jgi:hypothetical protein
MHGPWARRSWPSSRAWGGLIRRTGPAQLAVLVDQHQPGAVGPKQLLGGQHDLLQGGRQASFGVQGADGADALGQLGGIDRHGKCLPFGARVWRTDQQAS